MRQVKANTKIEPIINYLEKVIPSDYFLSDNFKMSCIEGKVDNLWNECMSWVKSNSFHTHCPGIDFNLQFVDDTLVKLMNDIYETCGEIELLKFVCFILDSYTSNEGKCVKTLGFKRAFAVIGVSEDKLALLGKYDEIPFATDISEDLSWFKDVNRMRQLKEEIEISFAKGNYRDVNTRTYTLLEGVFKGFLQQNSVVYYKRNNITQLASRIKDYLKENTLLYNEYCLQENTAISLITTVAHVVNDLRNRNSDSHFDGDSDMATSCFVKDLTYSVTNLLLNIKKNM